MHVTRHMRMHAHIYANVSRSGLVACLLTTAADLTTDHITAAAEPRRQQVPSADPATEEHDKAAQRSAPNPLSGNG